MIEFFHLENQQPTEKNNMSQFGPTSVPHCGGRACVRCGKCRDWYYVGNNWNHILNWKNWNDDDRALYWGDNENFSFVMRVVIILPGPNTCFEENKIDECNVGYNYLCFL
jgi:hypothetical protein